MTAASNIRPVNNTQLVVDAQFVKTNFLFGVDLHDDNGNEMPDSLIEFYILSAQQWLENELDILLLPTVITDEAHDYHFTDYTNFNFVRLFRKPVQDVSKVAMQFPLQTSVIDFNPEWFRIESTAAQVNLIPTTGTLSSIFIGAGGSFLPMLYSSREYVPHILYVSYTAGFGLGKIPMDMLELIGKKASIGPLNIAGDLIAGAGIATKSISIDGLSQSIGTTSSATNAGFGARILTYGKEIDVALKALRGIYRGLNMTVA